MTESAAERLWAHPPRYLFGISTGHAGSTSLSNKGSYEDTIHVTFKFEDLSPNAVGGNQEWRDWAATKPSLEDQEWKVRNDYKKTIDDLLAKEGTSTYVDIGHHNLHGILRTTPKVFGSDVFFIRLRRDRVHTAYSKQNVTLCQTMFRVCPTENLHLLSPGSGTWTEEEWMKLTGYQQSLWMIDEVEAEFQQLVRENPGASYLECNWSDDLGPCFEIVSSILGVQVKDGGLDLKQHTSKNLINSDDQKRIVQADEDYQSLMKYTHKVRFSIRAAQF
jgi:hypothetical protein